MDDRVLGPYSRQWKFIKGTCEVSVSKYVMFKKYVRAKESEF